MPLPGPCGVRMDIAGVGEMAWLSGELRGALDRFHDRTDTGFGLASAGGSELTMCAVNSKTHAGGSRKLQRKSRYEGIVVRHARGCRSHGGGRCSCDPGFQAQVWSARERKTIRKT